jgi:methionyl aminopeptidase
MTIRGSGLQGHYFIMIHIKNKEEIAIMQKAGHILADVLFAVVKEAKPGVSELDLDAMAERMIRERGGEEAFKHVPGWKYTICSATNDVVVHGIPTDRKLKEGDIAGIDCGVYLDGWNTDMAQTVYVGDKGKAPKEILKFLETGEKALWAGIEQVKPGNRVGHISKAIQEIVEGAGYSVVRDLIGHGVGRELHEEPEVPGYLIGSIEKTPLLKEGMTIAVEVIYNMGKKDVVYANRDGWTIKTKDGSLAGLFERSVVVTKDGVRVLTE